jgi:hypothetical protein
MKFPPIRALFLAVLCALFASAAFAGTVSITSPSPGSSVSSLHVTATASSSHTISTMKIYLDGNSIFTGSGSKIDTSLNASPGVHRITVKAWDSTGPFSSTVNVTLASTTSTDSTTIPSNATVFSNIDAMSGWDGCSDCAGAGGQANFQMSQHQSSPSLDGNSTKFSISGTKAFSHGLWWRRMSSNSTATHFIFDMNYYMSNPSASGGLEFAANQGRSDGWYKFSTQCSWNSNQWRVWDSKNGGWVATGIACNRPPANTWQHIVFEYARSGGKAVFVSITVNGTKHYVNKSFSPQAKSQSGSVGIHFQLNGNSSEDAYSVFTDKMKLTYW